MAIHSQYAIYNMQFTIYNTLLAPILAHLRCQRQLNRIDTGDFKLGGTIRANNDLTFDNIGG